MDIDELLKLQSTWIDRAQDTALQITRRGNGTTPEEAGLERTQLRREIEGSIRTLEARREASIRAFDAAIEKARRSLADLPPDRKPARTKPAASAAAKPGKGGR